MQTENPHSGRNNNKMVLLLLQRYKTKPKLQIIVGTKAEVRGVILSKLKNATKYALFPVQLLTQPAEEKSAAFAGRNPSDVPNGTKKYIPSYEI